MSPTVPIREILDVIILTEKLVADIVLLYEISKQLLVFASLVGNLHSPQKAIRDRIPRAYLGKRTAYRSIPERTAELDSFQKNRLGLFKIEVCPHGSIEAHSAEAGNRDLLVAKWECLDHLGGFRRCKRGSASL